MTFNQQYFDATLKHQIDLLRFGAGVARKVNGILDETRADLRKQVERRLGKTSGLDGAGLRRLRELERAIDQTRSPAWNDVTQEWTRTAIDVSLEEPVFVGGVLTNVLPVELDLVAPSDATLRALATTRPFQGKTLKEWADSARRADLTRIHQQIRIGMVQGESAQNIANRVFGARGATEITRGQAEAVTRTVISGVSNAAQQAFLADNSDLFDAEQLVATLDSRTTPICRAEDGKQYPIGKGPIPPLHVACRSIRVAVLDGEVVGERPFKAGTEQQMLREYADARGLGKVPKSREGLPKGSKKDFDAFSRRRMRELTGQVPARTTYQEWLKSQPAAIQDDILGPARGKLFREGGLTLDRFVNRQGDEFTLDELRVRNREAFEAAGIERSAPSVPIPAAVTPAPRTRAEALALLERHVDNVVIGPSVKDHEVVNAATALREQGIDKLYGGANPKLGNLVLGAQPSRPLPGDPLPVTHIESTSGGVFSAPWMRGGQSCLKVSSVSSDPTRERIEELRNGGRLRAPGPLGAEGRLVSIANRQDLTRTVTHEFGHAVHLERIGAHEEIDRIVRQVFSDHERKAVSGYGETNHLEYFAEAHTAYYHRRDELRAHAPKAYDMVERVLELRGIHRQQSDLTEFQSLDTKPASSAKPARVRKPRETGAQKRARLIAETQKRAADFSAKALAEREKDIAEAERSRVRGDKPMPGEIATRAEAEESLRRHIANLVIGEGVRDYEVVNIANAFRAIGGERLYSARKLENLVIGAKNTLKIPGKALALDELQSDAGGVFAFKVDPSDAKGANHIKLKEGAHDVDGEQVSMRRQARELSAADAASFGKAAAPDKLSSGFTIQSPDGQALTKTFIHEFGHAVHLERIGGHFAAIDDLIADAYRNRTTVSPYGETNHAEFFAESFAAYHLRPEALLRESPGAHKMVKEVLMLRGIE